MFLQVAGVRGVVDAKKLGTWLNREGKIAGKERFERAGITDGAARWKLRSWSEGTRGTSRTFQPNTRKVSSYSHNVIYTVSMLQRYVFARWYGQSPLSPWSPSLRSSADKTVFRFNIVPIHGCGPLR